MQRTFGVAGSVSGCQVAYSHSKGDLYWKIGLAVDDVQAAAAARLKKMGSRLSQASAPPRLSQARLGVPPGSQFRDIGFLTHMAGT